MELLGISQEEPHEGHRTVTKQMFSMILIFVFLAAAVTRAGPPLSHLEQREGMQKGGERSNKRPDL